MSKTLCCPPFNPEPWDDKTFVWKNKRFIKARVLCLFYFPLNFGWVIKRLHKKMQAASIRPDEYICLSDHTSAFNMNIYVAVNKSVPNAKNITVSGTFYSKVYNGPFSDALEWSRDFHARTHKKHLHLDKGYMWYTMCPKCSKLYGKNYIVLLGKVSKEKK